MPSIFQILLGIVSLVILIWIFSQIASGTASMLPGNMDYRILLIPFVIVLVAMVVLKKYVF